jgi:hypothetical protein
LHLCHGYHILSWFFPSINIPPLIVLGTSWGLWETGPEVSTRVSTSQLVQLSPPKPVTKGLFTPDSGLSLEERWQQVVSGGTAERQGDVIQGSLDAVAERLLQFLSRNNFV